MTQDIVRRNWRTPAQDLFDEYPIVDQLLLDVSTVRVEPAVLKALSELEVDAVHTAAILRDTHDHPVVELLGVGQVVHQMMSGHDVELVVENEHNISLVGKSR